LIDDATGVVPQPACDVTMDAQVLPLAMVALSLNAPCQPNAAVTIHHQGMMFTMVSDQFGQMGVLVLVLAQDAFFISAFADGAGAVAAVAVPELANVDRAVVQW
jgi:hemin uptake protein HemP